MAPQLIFGAASFGFPNSQFQEVDEVLALLESIKDQNVLRIDTGARYPPNNSGRSETLIGEASAISHDFVIDTKVMTGSNADGSGDLTIEAVDKSVEESLQRLKVNSVNVLYAHRPDQTTSVEEQVRAFNKQIDAGKAKEYGLSNHSVQQVEAFLQVCEQKGLRKPTVYEGDYNIITRGMETTLLPLLRKHGMRFNGFRAVAAGVLSGKLASGETEGTRFGGDGAIAQAMRNVFGSEQLHDTVRKLQTTLSKHNVSGIEVGLRWLYYHSPLTDEDGIILGASKKSQVEENLRLIRNGPLNDDILQALEVAWDELKESRGSIL